MWWPVRCWIVLAADLDRTLQVDLLNIDFACAIAEQNAQTGWPLFGKQHCWSVGVKGCACVIPPLTFHLVPWVRPPFHRCHVHTKLFSVPLKFFIHAFLYATFLYGMSVNHSFFSSVHDPYVCVVHQASVHCLVMARNLQFKLPSVGHPTFVTILRHWLECCHTFL